MKNGVATNGNRRSFFKTILAGILAIPAVESCRRKVAQVLLRMTGTQYLLGHRLWLMEFPPPQKTIETPILIIGGGISGLSAARYLAQQGRHFLLLDMEKETGGNSRNGENAYSKYPLGAHYLPLPNLDDKELLRFLEESKIIVGYANDKPVFDSKQLSFDPQERLFYRNFWQEDLMPKNPNDNLLMAESVRFFKEMAFFRQLKGKDGKYAFQIPIDASSQDIETAALDHITMKDWMEQNNFHSEELHWYVNYSCRDDYGLGYESVSAWAGIHYFAGRKNNYRENGDAVLTWPEGNARLAQHLKKYSEGNTLPNTIAYQVKIEGAKVKVAVYDNLQKSSYYIQADKVIMATPQFVNRHLLPQRKQYAKDFHYVPWVLATLVLKDLSQNSSFPLSWDNVIYGGKGLGYIFDQQQSLRQELDHYVITYYYPLSNPNTKAARKDIYHKSDQYWKDFILNDLKTAHPDIETLLVSMDIFRNGHAMISPTPGFIFGKSRKEAAEPINNKIFFAHTDLIGISIFEEAFHQGIKAAQQIISHETALDI